MSTWCVQDFRIPCYILNHFTGFIIIMILLISPYLCNVNVSSKFILVERMCFRDYIFCNTLISRLQMPYLWLQNGHPKIALDDVPQLQCMSCKCKCVSTNCDSLKKRSAFKITRRNSRNIIHVDANLAMLLGWGLPYYSRNSFNTRLWHPSSQSTTFGRQETKYNAIIYVYHLKNLHWTIVRTKV